MDLSRVTLIHLGGAEHIVLVAANLTVIVLLIGPVMQRSFRSAIDGKWREAADCHAYGTDRALRLASLASLQALATMGAALGVVAACFAALYFLMRRNQAYLETCAKKGDAETGIPVAGVG